MNRWGIPHISNRWLSVMLVTLGFFAFSGGEVQASCGDYVHIGGAQAAAMHDRDAVPMNEPSTGHSPVKLPCPCQGPSCEQHEPTPVPSSPPVPPSSPTDPVYLLAIDPESNGPSVRILIESSHLTLAGSSYRLDEPPRD